jgi:hypothetical protein
MKDQSTVGDRKISQKGGKDNSLGKKYRGKERKVYPKRKDKCIDDKWMKLLY